METGYSHRSSQYSNVHSTATVLCCTYPRHPIYPVWAARPRTRPLIGMLSLLSVTGVFQFPRPGQSPQSPFHHNITSKDWHRPRHRCSCWQLPFYLIKKTFHKFPWKLENSNCLVTDKRRGRKGNACQKLVLKLASAQSPVTTAAEADNGWTDLIHEVWRPGAWAELGPDFPSHFWGRDWSPVTRDPGEMARHTINTTH